MEKENSRVAQIVMPESEFNFWSDEAWKNRLTRSQFLHMVLRKVMRQMKAGEWKLD